MNISVKIVNTDIVQCYCFWDIIWNVNTLLINMHTFLKMFGYSSIHYSLTISLPILLSLSKMMWHCAFMHNESHYTRLTCSKRPWHECPTCFILMITIEILMGLKEREALKVLEKKTFITHNVFASLLCFDVSYFLHITHYATQFHDEAMKVSLYLGN